MLNYIEQQFDCVLSPLVLQRVSTYVSMSILYFVTVFINYYIDIYELWFIIANITRASGKQPEHSGLIFVCMFIYYSLCAACRSVPPSPRTLWWSAGLTAAKFAAAKNKGVCEKENGKIAVCESC